MSKRTVDKILVSDFDGTMSQRDFYWCAANQLLTPDDLAPWDAYTRQEMTHFEALASIFQRIRGTIHEMEQVLASMQFDSNAASAVEQLESSGWKVVVVSNGCEWYIDRLFQQHHLILERHSNPGEYSPEQGLQMRLPTTSPFLSEEFGISKSAVIRDALENYKTVAFAGDGRADLEPALMVRPELRFARDWLATELTSLREPFQSFSTWSEIALLLGQVSA